MDKEELKEVMRLLKEAGIDAQLCDTPVPVSANPARCGWPEDLEDECIDDYILLPKAVVGQYPEMFIPAIGDSMIEAGYEEGDMLRVRFGVEARDGKDMLMLINGKCTVKTIFTDEDGVKWLLPDHEHLPTVKELSRMAVQSFVKKIDLWDRNDAPVTGTRFDYYLRIARMTDEKLKP